MLTPSCFASLRRYEEASRTDGQNRSAKQLSDEQWLLIEDFFSWEPPSRVGGRPPVPPRVVLEALLWLLRNGGRWQDLPEWAPSESTCRRRLKEWTEQGLLTAVWSRLVELADELGQFDWEHLIADGTFCRAKKGAISSASAAKATARRPWCSWTATERPWAW